MAWISSIPDKFEFPLRNIYFSKLEGSIPWRLSLKANLASEKKSLTDIGWKCEVQFYVSCVSVT